jgi:hypothetical protein
VIVETAMIKSFDELCCLLHDATLYPGLRQSRRLAIYDRLQWPAGLAGVVAQGGDAGFPG